MTRDVCNTFAYFCNLCNLKVVFGVFGFSLVLWGFFALFGLVCYACLSKSETICFESENRYKTVQPYTGQKDNHLCLVTK